jgi:hypothetical protein
MKKIILLTILMFPTLVFADIYQDIAGSSQMIADELGGFWTFFFEDIPSIITDFFKYFMQIALEVRLFIMSHMLLASWAIAKELIESLQIMSTITSNLNILPQDVKQVLVDTRLFEGVNLIFQAYVTRFVMDQF